MMYVLPTIILDIDEPEEKVKETVEQLIKSTFKNIHLLSVSVYNDKRIPK